MTTQTVESNIYTVGEESMGDMHASGVSWGAVFAGGAVAAALSLILLILGFGLGLSSISPWSYNAAAIGTGTILWLAFMQLAASGVGGYLAGRLRVKWAGVHTDEVFFRDTAHGLLTWAVASLFTAALLAGAVRAILGGALTVGTEAAGAAAPVLGAAVAAGGPDTALNPVNYFSDMLLRSDRPAADANNDAALRSEVSKILVTDLRAGQLAPEDRNYLAQLIARRTGLSQADAQRRVDDIYARASKASNDVQAAAKQAAESARKAAAHSALWMFVALLLGAFVASWAATFGGRQRDHLVLQIR